MTDQPGTYTGYWDRDAEWNRAYRRALDMGLDDDAASDSAGAYMDEHWGKDEERRKGA